jgi:nitroimidazol reductase NimA-like FMN-containing flavoprotein (pyridoxamine 5'-phosphate oxidase superfamily)
VTLNYGFSWDADRPILYFHCANAGRKLEILKRNRRACFGIDIDHGIVGGTKGCDWGMKYRSVVGYGDLEIIEDSGEREKGLRLLMEQYSGSRDFGFETNALAATTVLRIRADKITGKKNT